MSVSDLDSDRPPEPPRGRRSGTRRRRRRMDPFRAGGGDGTREAQLVGDIQFDSYYGRQVVKAPPWRGPIAAYLFLGGLAGGCGMLSLGAQLTDRPALCRNSRLVALGAVGLGTAALIEDLGRPERFLNMMRTFKVTSPMSLGTWLLGGFGTVSGVLGAIEVGRVVGEQVPLRSPGGLVHGMETPLALAQGALGPALASYTGALLADTAVPTWAASRDHLSYLFVSSASLATGGAAMVTTPVVEAGPARLLAAAGEIGRGAGRGRERVRRRPGGR